MTGGFQVTMSRLRDAARRFRAGAETLTGVLRASGPAPADGGSRPIEDALSAVLESVGLLNARFGGALAADGAGLAASNREYQHAEDETTRAIASIAPAGKPR